MGTRSEKFTKIIIFNTEALFSLAQISRLALSELPKNNFVSIITVFLKNTRKLKVFVRVSCMADCFEVAFIVSNF